MYISAVHILSHHQKYILELDPFTVFSDFESTSVSAAEQETTMDKHRTTVDEDEIATLISSMSLSETEQNSVSTRKKG